jgi:sugar phosphate isomerase/epimerase
MDAILSLDGARDLHWLFETHDGWARADQIALLLDAVPAPAFGLLWDVGNTAEMSKEPPHKIIAAGGKRLGYIHVKDAVRAPDHPQAVEGGWRYVNPGEGDFCLDEAISALKKANYEGWIVLEHEKRWHPEIQEPEEILPAFVRWSKTWRKA